MNTIWLLQSPYSVLLRIDYLFHVKLKFIFLWNRPWNLDFLDIYNGTCIDRLRSFICRRLLDLSFLLSHRSSLFSNSKFTDFDYSFKLQTDPNIDAYFIITRYIFNMKKYFRHSFDIDSIRTRPAPVKAQLETDLNPKQWNSTWSS